MYCWSFKDANKEALNKFEETKEPNASMAFHTLRGLLKHNKLTRKDLEKIDSKYPDHELKYKVKGTENTIWRVHVIC